MTSVKIKHSLFDFIPGASQAQYNTTQERVQQKNNAVQFDYYAVMMLSHSLLRLISRTQIKWKQSTQNKGK